MQIAISEALVDLAPDDFGTRFALAYMHSEVGNDDLSLNHYLKIPRSPNCATASDEHQDLLTPAHTTRRAA